MLSFTEAVLVYGGMERRNHLPRGDWGEGTIIAGFRRRSLNYLPSVVKTKAIVVISNSTKENEI